ncbi:skin secretory protein xP2 [Plutella xylostella]|uniref:skin secretory protein xP2 n=1 Tax=Plutella xylostella TaxID=51655 RepID=UPI002032F7C4|nr:skin secretory protein xP2 [Plutella xylostella]
MRITALVVLLACVACGAHARAQDEDRTPSRGLLKRGLLAKGKATTTTTTPAPQEEAEYEDEAEYPAEESPEPSSEAPPSSTEGKKLGGVRPFRSNTDLLETLKRRRQQAAEAKLHGHSATTAAPAQSDAPTEAPVKANFSKKRFTSGSRDSNTEESSPAGKPSRNRFGRPAKSIQEVEPEVEQNDAAPPARTGRTFSGRRGGN